MKINGFEGLNVPREKAPESLDFKNEYQYNQGYYFANCEWLSLINSNCYYLKKGCTGCTKKPLNNNLSFISTKRKFSVKFKAKNVFVNKVDNANNL